MMPVLAVAAMIHTATVATGNATIFAIYGADSAAAAAGINTRLGARVPTLFSYQVSPIFIRSRLKFRRMGNFSLEVGRLQAAPALPVDLPARED